MFKFTKSIFFIFTIIFMSYINIANAENIPTSDDFASFLSKNQKIITTLKNGSIIVSNEKYHNFYDFLNYVKKIYTENKVVMIPSEVLNNISDSIDLLQTKDRINNKPLSCKEVDNFYYSGFNKVFSISCSDGKTLDINSVPIPITDDITFEDSNILIDDLPKKEEDSKNSKDGKDNKNEKKDNSDNSSSVDYSLVQNSYKMEQVLKGIFEDYQDIYNNNICHSVTSFSSQVDNIGNENFILSCDNGLNNLLIITNPSNPDKTLFIEKKKNHENKYYYCFKSANMCTNDD